MWTAKFKIPVQGRRPLHSENNLCVSLWEGRCLPTAL
jgi:hypothetical protein